MNKVNSKYAGKLMPGASADLRKNLNEYKKLFKEGLIKGVEVLGCPNCAVSEAQKGKVYSIEQTPKLPLAGCTRSPCCGCDYIPTLK